MDLVARTFGAADETTQFPNGFEHIVKLEEIPIGLATFQPGWRWSNDVRPIMGTEHCPLHHVGYVLSGRLHVETTQGATIDLVPGDVFSIPAGHDAWVVGDEACTMLDWAGKVKAFVQPADKAVKAR